MVMPSGSLVHRHAIDLGEEVVVRADQGPACRVPTRSLSEDACDALSTYTFPTVAPVTGTEL